MNKFTPNWENLPKMESETIFLFLERILTLSGLKSLPQNGKVWPKKKFCPKSEQLLENERKFA
jgi:hypothetical protein